MNEPEQPVARMFAAYKAAVQAKDVDAFVALYGEDACIFDMWDAWSYQGRAPWRAMAENWFGSLGANRLIVDAGQVRSFVAGDAAMAHANMSYAAVSAEGKRLHAITNRLTWALRQRRRLGDRP